MQDTCVDGHIDTNINAPVAHVEARVDGEVISQATPDGTSDSSMTGYAALSAPQDRSADQRVKNSEAFAPKMKYITAGICLLVVAAVFVAVIVFQ